MTNCALLATGAIDCWGNNSDGELGSGSTTAPDCGGTCSTTPVQVSGSTNATEITAREQRVRAASPDCACAQSWRGY